MKLAPKRTRRIRDEMRLWLRSHHGIRTGYPQDAIDQGREDLGFSGVEDALIAYTLFGGDLMPGMVELLDLDVSANEIAAIVEALPGDLADVVDLLGGE